MTRQEFFTDVRKNQIKTVLFQLLVAIITNVFVMGWFIYYAAPNFVLVFLLLFLSLGMTLKWSENPGERANSVFMPILLNLGLFIVGLIGAGGFIGPLSGAEAIYWLPYHWLNPNITFAPFFMETAGNFIKHAFIIFTPSVLMYLGMIIGNKVRVRLSGRVNNMNLRFMNPFKSKS